MLTETRTATSPTRPDTPAEAPREDPAVPGIGRAAMNGAIIGFVSIVTLVSAVALLAGVELVSAFGIAFFAAAWDGLAMGAMFGAWLYFDRIRDADLKMHRSGAKERARAADARNRGPRGPIMGKGERSARR